MKERTTTRRRLLTAMLAASSVALAGCKQKAGSQKTPEEKEVTLVVRAAKNCNDGRPLQIVVRTTMRKSFVEEDYSAVARLVVVPDESVVQTLLVFPGQVAVIPLKFDKYPEALGVYGMFNRGKGESWKKLADRPLEIDVVAGESAFERWGVREREASSK